MEVAYFIEWNVGTEQQAIQVGEKLRSQGAIPPQGSVFHAEGAVGSGQWVFDIWESEEHAREFYDRRLAPILKEFDAPEPNRRSLGLRWHSNQPPLE
ncbi:MAG: hypothetical protein WKH64_10490 [Chloroflexia bacterium]